MTEKLSLHDIGDKNLLLKIFPVLSWQGMKYGDCSSSVTAVESGQACRICVTLKAECSLVVVGLVQVPLGNVNASNLHSFNRDQIIDIGMKFQ